MGKKVFIITTIFCISFYGLNAQTREDILRQRAAEEVSILMDYISEIASKQHPLSDRLFFKDQALKLFIGGGEAYKKGGRLMEGVFMQTTSKNHPGQVNNKLMKTYLVGLANLKYSEVKISSTELAQIKVSKIRKVDVDEYGRTIYECTCYIKQEFCGYRDGRPVYRDITKKSITCRIIEELTEQGYEYIVRLGDVKALETI